MCRWRNSAAGPGAVIVLLLAVTGHATEPRVLSAAFLLGEAPLEEPVPMAEYTPPPEAPPPRHRFSGVLRPQTTSADGFRLLQDEFDRASGVGDALRALPRFDLGYVQDGSDLVPLTHGVLRTGHPYWELILQPGRAWQEPGDGGWSRASAPFALQERAANCTHYGVMTWLFDEAGRVSRAAWQIVSETCAYLRFDAWGVMDVDHEAAQAGALAEAQIDRFRRHAAARLPVRPLARLAEDYPDVDPSSLGYADGLEREDLTVLGLVADGIHYRSDCPTRYGPYPYCTSLPLPSYSTAKSLFAGVGLMRLEQMSPGASQTPIASLIDACDPERWGDVTLENALDMATGNYDSARPYEDEDAPGHLDFIFSDSHAEKLRLACGLFPRRAEPGTRFVYHTSDTYLVGTGMQRVLDRGGQADVYRELLLDSVWRPLRLGPLLDGTKRSYDRAAQPFTGYGLTYEADDVVRVARWLMEGDGRIGGAQVLDRSLLDGALQWRPDDRGLAAGDVRLRYNNGFWAYDAGPDFDCGHPVWVPFMSGFGGIAVAMFPNGVIYYYYSDGHLHRWGSGRKAAHAIGNLCGEAHGATVSATLSVPRDR